MIVASLSNINKTRETGELSARSMMSNVDTKDTIVSSKIYKLVFTELYIYKDFADRCDEEVG